MIDLDQLLGNHQLSSSQERELRRYLNYNLVKKNMKLRDDLHVEFCYKQDLINPMHRVYIHKLSDFRKNNQYNEIMYKLIKEAAHNVDSILTIRQIKNLIKNDPILSKQNEVFGIKLQFKNDFADMTLPFYTNLTSQTLFKVLKLVWNVK